MQGVPTIQAYERLHVTSKLTIYSQLRNIHSFQLDSAQKIRSSMDASIKYCFGMYWYPVNVHPISDRKVQWSYPTNQAVKSIGFISCVLPATIETDYFGLSEVVMPELEIKLEDAEVFS